MKFDKLLTALRVCADMETDCSGCPYIKGCINNPRGIFLVMRDAADAIEELTASVESYEDTTDMTFIEEEGRIVIRFLPKWIPITERLPEKDGFYLVSYRIEHKGEAGTAVLPFHSKAKVFGYPDEYYDPFAYEGWVTHWMPLPEPPKEDNDI